MLKWALTSLFRTFMNGRCLTCHRGLGTGRWVQSEAAAAALRLCPRGGRRRRPPMCLDLGGARKAAPDQEGGLCPPRPGQSEPGPESSVWSRLLPTSPVKRERQGGRLRCQHPGRVPGMGVTFKVLKEGSQDEPLSPTGGPRPRSEPAGSGGHWGRGCPGFWQRCGLGQCLLRGQRQREAPPGCGESKGTVTPGRSVDVTAACPGLAPAWG